MTPEERPLTLKQIREANLERDRQIFREIGVWSTPDWAVAFVGEVGEAMNKLKKLRKAHGNHPKWQPGDVTVEDVAEELADALVYLDILAHNLGIDLEQAYRRKFNKVSDAIGAQVKL